MALVGGKIQIRTIYHLLFSNFPCNQATFCNIDYLKDADDPEGNIDNYLINTMFF